MSLPQNNSSKRHYPIHFTTIIHHYPICTHVSRVISPPKPPCYIPHKDTRVCLVYHTSLLKLNSTPPQWLHSFKHFFLILQIPTSFLNSYPLMFYDAFSNHLKFEVLLEWEENRSGWWETMIKSKVKFIFQSLESYWDWRWWQEKKKEKTEVRF